MKTEGIAFRIPGIAVVLLALMAPGSRAGGLYFYSIAKGIYYHQEAGSIPEVRPFKPCFFQAQMVFTNTFGSLGFITITPPTSHGVTLRSPFNSSTASYTDRETNQTALDLIFANGSYLFSFGSAPVQHVSNILSSASCPPAPMVANLTDAQAIDPAKAFTLRWNAFAGGRTNDLIICSLQSSSGTVFQTISVPNVTNGLNGTAISVTIPTNTLSSGRSYFGRLIFATVQSVVTNQYTNAFGATLYESQTDFYVRTSGAGDTMLPSLISSFPRDRSTAVPTNSPIVFTFNKPMVTGWAISISAVVTAPSGWNWNADSTRMGATVTEQFVTNRPNAIVLNQLDDQLLFCDTQGNLLPPDTVISFTTDSSNYSSNTPVLLPLRWPSPTAPGLDLEGATNSQCVLEGSTDFVNWNPLLTNAVFDGTAAFTDTNATSLWRFYRTVGY